MKQCIQFYYLWKKVCPEDYKQFQFLRRKARTEDSMVNPKLNIPVSKLYGMGFFPTNSNAIKVNNNLSVRFQSMNNKMGLGPHMRLQTNETPDRRQTSTPTQIEPNYDEFPCKICGKYVVIELSIIFTARRNSILNVRLY